MEYIYGVNIFGLIILNNLMERLKLTIAIIIATLFTIGLYVVAYMIPSNNVGSVSSVSSVDIWETEVISTSVNIAINITGVIMTFFTLFIFVWFIYCLFYVTVPNYKGG